MNKITITKASLWVGIAAVLFSGWVLLSGGSRTTENNSYDEWNDFLGV